MKLEQRNLSNPLLKLSLKDTIEGQNSNAIVHRNCRDRVADVSSSFSVIP